MLETLLPWFMIAGSSATVYLFLLLAFRLMGKGELSQLSVVDLVFVLLISNAVQNAMVGPDATLLGGLVAASTLFLINILLRYLSQKFPSFGKVLQGEPMILIYQGQLNITNFIKSKFTQDELWAALREQGIENQSQVHLAILERAGKISVFREPPHPK